MDNDGATHSNNIIYTTNNAGANLVARAANTFTKNAMPISIITRYRAIMTSEISRSKHSADLYIKSQRYVWIPRKLIIITSRYITVATLYG